MSLLSQMMWLLVIGLASGVRSSRIKVETAIHKAGSVAATTDADQTATVGADQSSMVKIEEHVSKNSVVSPDFEPRLFVFDFDKTITRFHVGQRYQKAALDKIPITDATFANIAAFRSFVERAQNEGHPVAIVSHGRKDLLNKAMEYALGRDYASKGVVISTPEDFGGQKPDMNRQLVSLHKQLGVDLNRITYFDDDLNNIKRAFGRLGVHAIHTPNGINPQTLAQGQKEPVTSSVQGSRQLFVFDFDKTIASFHVWQTYQNKPLRDIPITDATFTDLKAFRKFVEEALKNEDRVAVASFGRKDVVTKAIKYAFGNDHNFVISTPEDFGHPGGSNNLGDKNWQLVALRKNFGVDFDHITLFDDDPNNVMMAKMELGANAIHTPNGLTKAKLDESRSGGLKKIWKKGKQWIKSWFKS